MNKKIILGLVIMATVVGLVFADDINDSFSNLYNSTSELIDTINNAVEESGRSTKTSDTVLQGISNGFKQAAENIKKCSFCRGERICSSCKGSGIFYGMECSSCNGNGMCKWCKGSGER